MCFQLLHSFVSSSCSSNHTHYTFSCPSPLSLLIPSCPCSHMCASMHMRKKKENCSILLLLLPSLSLHDHSNFHTSCMMKMKFLSMHNCHHHCHRFFLFTLLFPLLFPLLAPALSPCFSPLPRKRERQEEKREDRGERK